MEALQIYILHANYTQVHTQAPAAGRKISHTQHQSLLRNVALMKNRGCTLKMYTLLEGVHKKCTTSTSNY